MGNHGPGLPPLNKGSRRVKPPKIRIYGGGANLTLFLGQKNKSFRTFLPQQKKLRKKSLGKKTNFLRKYKK